MISNGKMIAEYLYPESLFGAIFVDPKTHRKIMVYKKALWRLWHDQEHFKYRIVDDVRPWKIGRRGIISANRWASRYVRVLF